MQILQGEIAYRRAVPAHQLTSALQKHLSADIVEQFRKIYITFAFDTRELQYIFPPTANDTDRHTSRRIGFGVTAFEKITGRLGWWVASITPGYGIYKGMTVVRMTSLAEPVRPKPKYLYHTTPIENEDRIKRKGLIPRSRHTKKFRYIIPKVHLYTKYDSAFFDEMMFDIHNLDRDNIGVDDRDLEYVIFRIDTTKFAKFNIFPDNMAGGLPAVYTLSHIPAKAISVHEYRATKNLRSK